MGLSSNNMNKFNISFSTRQEVIKANLWLEMQTLFGPMVVQYCPCTELFGESSNGCTQWTYTFCVQDNDLPSGIESACSITPDILVAPYLTALPHPYLEDSLTVDVQGDGSEAVPFNFNVIVDPDTDNQIEERANGLFVDAGAGGGQDGADGADGADGLDGTNGADGADGTNGTDGVDGANGAGPAVGSINMMAGTIPPANTEILLGQLVNRITWPELWDYAVTSGNIVDDATWLGDSNNVGKFSTGDGVNTFRVPNLKGYFFRAWNPDTGGTQPDDGRAFGSVQDHAIENITGSVEVGADIVSTSGALTAGAATATGASGAGASTELDFDASGSVNTDPDETRPKNIAYMYVIQAASIV